MKLLSQMAAALRHRGPDDEGYVVHAASAPFRCFRGDDTVPEFGDLPHWRSADGRGYPVGLCHRRLSILDLTSAGHQPMISGDGNLALVFGGEIYNYLELADELEALGWRLKPCGDTAVLLAAFHQWGPACVDRLRGMWALAAFDRRSGRLTLSRDRFGIKPIYYARVNGSLAFSSEIKGLLPFLPGAPRGSTRETVRVLMWGRTDDEEATLFEDVRALPAGCNLHVDTRDLTCRVERYYDVSAATNERFDGSLEDAVHEYQQRLDESVRLHLRSDVQVGSCLSGGIDSNLTAALATRHLPNRGLTTFTAVYEDPALDERRYVEAHAAQSGRLETKFVSPTATSLHAEIDQLVWAQDQPMASTSPFAQWAVMRLAAENKIKVLLDGQGADEALGGYSYFAGAQLLELARAGRISRALREARLLKEHRSVSIWRELGRATYHQLPPLLQASARRAARAGYQLVTPSYREHAGRPHKPAPRTFRDYSIDAVRHSLPELLRYEDRSSMAFSIESRVPFLDHPLVELTLSLPTNFKIHDGWTKFVQRRAAEAVLPAEIVWRRDKLGFTTPQRDWKRQLAAPLQEYVRAHPMPPFLDRIKVEQLLASESSKSVTLSEFWKTIFMLKWIDAYSVQFSD